MTDDIKGPEARYFEKLAQGIFEIQRCATCREHQFFPRALCVHCGSTQLDWVKPSGAGTVYSYSVVRRKPEAGGDYNVILVDLDEGVRLMSCIDKGDENGIFIGQKVSARVALRNGAGVVVFDAAEVTDA